MGKPKFQYVNLDAEEGIFFERELEKVEDRIVEIDYPELKASTLIPVDTNYTPGQDSIVWYEMDRVGVAKIVANDGNDYPRVDIFMKENRSPVRNAGDSFGYTHKDIRQARLANRPLDSMKAEAARKALYKLEDDIAFEGDANYGLLGFFDIPSISEVVFPADGTGASQALSSKDADLILRDLQALESAPFENTNGIEIIDTMILPLAQYRLITTKRIPDTQITIAEFFLKSSFTKSIDFTHKLAGRGAGDSDRMMVYKRSPDKVKMARVMDFEMGNPIESKREFEVACEMEIGAIICYKPLSIAFADNV